MIVKFHFIKLFVSIFLWVAISAPDNAPDNEKVKKRLQSAINSQTKKIKSIYARALRRDKSIGGHIQVKFTIMPEGHCDSISIICSTTDNPQFDSKVLKAIRKWNFAKCNLIESIEIKFPFAFGAGRSDYNKCLQLEQPKSVKKKE